jgi:general transcription factor 3C polypeptide 5 (transcription factor C subunit 1)
MFDGIHLTRETGSFQLCDITDPFLRELVEAEDELYEECNVCFLFSLIYLYTLTSLEDRNGWYTAAGLEAIKTILRHKFFSLLDGHVASDEECARLLVPTDETGRMPVPLSQRRRRHGKHNMAKGALPPEETVAYRLQAQIEQGARKTKKNNEESEG